MITKKSEDAVSPVIGIMLLVVVTVIIAAVITAFATGVVGSTEPVPVAVLDVEIFSNQENMAGLSGPELFITHISGDAVDTNNIELRTSWTHKNVNGEECSHYSIFTAEGFKNSGTDLENREQPLYVKSTMLVNPDRDEYGSTGINHYFGDVILTPGLRLSASSEFLNMNIGDNTQSRFMDAVFNNYKVTTDIKWIDGYYYNIPNVNYPVTSHDPATCTNCLAGNADNCVYKMYYEASLAGNCVTCGHSYDLCNAQNDPYHECKCLVEDDYFGTPEVVGGIMNHLQPGTEVDFMIVHIPSGKAIYDNTVVVQ